MNTNTSWRIVVEPNDLTRQRVINVIAQSGHSHYAAFGAVEEMEAGIETDASDAMLLVNLGHDIDSTAQGIRHLKSRYPASQIVLLSNTYSHSHLLSAIDAGASGYFLTSMSCDELAKSLDVIKLGQPIIPKEALKLIGNGEAEAVNEALPSRVPSSVLHSGILSDRELAVLRCISRTKSNREGHIAEARVKTHVKAILQKINRKEPY